ncbi:MAG TPA: aminoglycoside adenylyltransferase domain-containing protein [Solirubrobacteraceae bacterium]
MSDLVNDHYPKGSRSTPVSETARTAIADLLGRLDRELPGRIEGFYVVGSACLGAFRPARSDVDFVAIVDGELDARDLRRLRAVHRRLWMNALARDAGLRRRWPLVCNGSYLRPDDLSRSPLEVTPLAGHVAGRFAAAEPGFDVNPVTWHTLAHHGIAVRGPDPKSVRIRTDAADLHAWTLENLNGYWRRWVVRAGRPGLATLRTLPRRFTAWGVLGAPRLHYTLTTDEVTSKEEAGRYALETFAPEWREVIEEALAFWRGGPAVAPFRLRPDVRRRAAAAFVAHVIESANRLPSTGAPPQRQRPAPGTAPRAR